MAEATPGPGEHDLRRVWWCYCSNDHLDDGTVREYEASGAVDVTVVYGGVTQPVIHTSVRIKEFTKIHE